MPNIFLKKPLLIFMLILKAKYFLICYISIRAVHKKLDLSWRTHVNVNIPLKDPICIHNRSGRPSLCELISQKIRIGLFLCIKKWRLGCGGGGCRRRFQLGQISFCLWCWFAKIEHHPLLSFLSLPSTSHLSISPPLHLHPQHWISQCAKEYHSVSKKKKRLAVYRTCHHCCCLVENFESLSLLT